MAMPSDPYPSPPPTIRFDVINQAFALFQQQMGQWVVIVLVYAVVVGVASFLLNLVPLVGFASGIPGMILTGGVFKAALKHVRGEAVAVADLFDIGDIVGPLVVAGILVNIGTTIGLFLCLLPGIVLAGLWMFTSLLIVDRGMDGIAAMRESWVALKGQWAMAGVFVVVVGIVAAIGIIGCGVGVLFTLPIAFLSVALLYRDFYPEGAAPVDPFAPPASPP